ncbi:hypothetical protein CBS101457_003617 [Exobasidium rhododendri]|nr:hypothetical protein CBS101457_003617 [Exobasidium rhododendri]
MTKPFLKFYQDLSKVIPPAADKPIVEYSFRLQNWILWLDERQLGSRWVRSKVRRAGDVGLQEGLDWRETWTCDHAGPYRCKKNSNLSPQKKRKGKISIKTGCMATITASKVKNADNILVSWRHEHGGHNPMSVKDWRASSLSEHIRTWVKERIAEGRDWRSIHDLLRIKELEIDLLDSTSTRLPQALRLTRQDVYNILRQQLVAVSRKDPDLMKSLESWIAQIVKDGGWGYTSKDSVGFATAWQQSLWGASTFCLDSTHNTCQGGFYLYTLVARSKITGRGCPAAFFLTPDAGQTPLEAFLKSLPIKPDFFMIDCSHAEAGAIMAVHPRAKIMYCNWHVLKAVRGRAKTIIQHANARERNTLIQEAFNDFRAIMQLEDTSLYFAAYQNFTKKWTNLQQPAWAIYFARTWNPFRSRWIKAWRLDFHDGIDTNNYIESWHGRLKTQYLQTLRKQRADYLVHLLVDKIVPDYRQESKQVELGILLPTLSKAERAAKQKASKADLTLVSGDTVGSFTGPGSYKLIDGICTCLANKPCKHMFLVQRLQIAGDNLEAPEWNCTNAVLSEKQDLLQSVAIAMQQVSAISGKLSTNCSRQKLGDLHVKLVALKHEISDVVLHRSPSATQS